MDNADHTISEQSLANSPTDLFANENTSFITLQNAPHAFNCSNVEYASSGQVFERIPLAPYADLAQAPKKRKIFVTSQEYNAKENEQPLEDERNSASNTRIIELLNTIIQNQQKFEESTNKRLQNLERMVQEKALDKNDVLAQNKMIREGLVISRQMLKATQKICGEVVSEEELDISSTLPLSTLTAVKNLENRLQEECFQKAMQAYLYKLKAVTASVDDVMKQLINDKLMDQYNWDGRVGKQSLKDLQLINKYLFDIFSPLGRPTFEKQIRKSVELSHNRYKHKKREISAASAQGSISQAPS